MLPSAKSLLIASLLLGVVLSPANAAEREDVRKVINLVTSVKMPYPENLPRNRAKTERVWLEREGAMTGCIKLEERRWCYEHIPPHRQSRGDAAHPQRAGTRRLHRRLVLLHGRLRSRRPHRCGLDDTDRGAREAGTAQRSRMSSSSSLAAQSAATSSRPNSRRCTMRASRSR